MRPQARHEGEREEERRERWWGGGGGEPRVGGGECGGGGGRGVGGAARGGVRAPSSSAPGLPPQVSCPPPASPLARRPRNVRGRGARAVRAALRLPPTRAAASASAAWPPARCKRRVARGGGGRAAAASRHPHAAGIARAVGPGGAVPPPCHGGRRRRPHARRRWAVAFPLLPASPIPLPPVPPPFPASACTHTSLLCGGGSLVPAPDSGGRGGLRRLHVGHLVLATAACGPRAPDGSGTPCCLCGGALPFCFFFLCCAAVPSGGVWCQGASA